MLNLLMFEFYAAALRLVLALNPALSFEIELDGQVLVIRENIIDSQK